MSSLPKKPLQTIVLNHFCLYLDRFTTCMRTFTSLNALCCQKKWGDVRKWKLFLNFLFRKASRQLIWITHWSIYSMSMLNGLLCGLNYTNFICNLGNVEHVHNSVTKWVASALTMQSKAYTKEIQPENWAVSMDIYHLSSAPMPELQWLSW